MSGADEAETGVRLPPLTEHIGYLLRRAQLLTFQDYQEGTADIGLTPAEYAALALLQEHPGMRQNRLTELLSVKAANCVTLINKLEAEGFVRREKLRISGRAVALSLTSAGEDVLQRMNAKVTEHFGRICLRLGRQETFQLIDLLKRFVDAPGIDR